MHHYLLKGVFVSLLLALGSHGYASEDEMDIDTRFRAKIAKTRVKVAAMERKAQENGGQGGGSGADCGSQSIGNVNTGGRIGSGPREVFVFAPNAINLVSRGGCK